jgi:hypothetical protein
LRGYDDGFFLTQESTDRFVRETAHLTAPTCGGHRAGKDDGKAGEKLKKSFKDENALAAIVCSHGMVRTLSAVRGTGERFSHFVHMMLQFDETFPGVLDDSTFGYDVACKLEPHIKVYYSTPLTFNRRTILNCTTRLERLCSLACMLMRTTIAALLDLHQDSSRGWG